MTPSAEPAPVETLVTEVVDDFMARVHRGENPDIEEYASRHPAIAKLLRELLPALQVMGPASLPGEPGCMSAASAHALVPGCLGDFYIIRQIGQGGMGTVYEAEQISLVRRVALKILPFASTLDSKQLQRFQNEARAAAHLHHPHIVPVYTAGCERGVHYYAMQYIEGQSLAALIADLRLQIADRKERASDVYVSRPEGTTRARNVSTECSRTDREFFRTVARWGKQAAEALDHAHELSIVHRDIKPANLLVDASSNVWVTDFGLARLQGDNGLTMTGDLLGTLRYMSPEQAQAGRNQVDHRTDIYSLGITLYELLTLEPAFAGSDRHELLRRISIDEPSAPRRLNAAIPDELETILLKAIGKGPGERYPAARELAEDFGRFLEDKPIRARRPSLMQRLKRRVRRHKAALVFVSISAAVMTVLAVVALALSNVRIAHEQAQTRQALAEAEANHLAAEQHRAKAEANFQKARAAVDQMLTEVSKNELLGSTQMEPVRRTLLEKALTFYQGFLEEKANDPSIRFETGRAYFRVGDIYFQLAQPIRSEKAYRLGLELLEKLLEEFPTDPRYRQEAASNCIMLGTLLRQDLGRTTEAEPYYRRGLALWESLAADFPTNAFYREQLAHACHDLGYQLRDADRLAEAEALLRRALAQRQKIDQESRGAGRLGLAQTYNSLGLLERTKGRLAQAEEAHRAALAHLQASDYAELARSQAHLGIVLGRRGRFEEAETAVRHAVALRAKLVANEPKSWPAHQELALTYLSLGSLMESSEHSDRAEEPYRQALDFQEKLLRDWQDHPESSKNLALCHMALGRFLHGTNRVNEAEKSFRAASRIYRDQLTKTPDNPQVNQDLAWFLATCPVERFRDPGQAVVLAKKATDLDPGTAHYWTTLGVAHYRAENWQAARQALEKSIPRAGASQVPAQFFLAMTHWRLGSKAEARRCFDQADAALAANNVPGNSRFRAEAAALLGIRQQSLLPGSQPQ